MFDPLLKSPTDAPSLNDANEFSLYIETSAHTKKITVLDAVVQYCEENSLDAIDVVPFINRSLKDKLKSNFIEARMLPQQPQLEF